MALWLDPALLLGVGRLRPEPTAPTPAGGAPPALTPLCAGRGAAATGEVPLPFSARGVGIALGPPAEDKGVAAGAGAGAMGGEPGAAEGKGWMEGWVSNGEELSLLLMTYSVRSKRRLAHLAPDAWCSHRRARRVCAVSPTRGDRHPCSRRSAVAWGSPAVVRSRHGNSVRSQYLFTLTLTEL